MGRSLADIQTRYPHLPYQLQASENGLPMIATAAGLLNPIRVSADILKALAERATGTAHGGDLDGVVITVPPIFDAASVRGTKRRRASGGSARAAPVERTDSGSDCLRPSTPVRRVIAVYDPGGGTLISRSCACRGVFEVLATGGGFRAGRR